MIYLHDVEHVQSFQPLEKNKVVYFIYFFCLFAIRYNVDISAETLSEVHTIGYSVDTSGTKILLEVLDSSLPAKLDVNNFIMLKHCLDV